MASFGNWNNKPKVTWYLPDRFKMEFSELFEIVDRISVEKDYTPNNSEINASFSAGWQHVIESVDKQFEYEKENGETKSFPLKNLTKKKKVWNLR